MKQDPIKLAWDQWYWKYYPWHEADQLIDPYLKTKSSKGWLKRARQALFLSTGQVASRAGIVRSNYCESEGNEENLTLAKLTRLAEAMDCELVYAIRPKTQQPYSRRIWEVLLGAVLKKYPPTDNGMCLAASLRDTMYNPRFRKAQKWCRNNDPAGEETIWYLNRLRVPK